MNRKAFFTTLFGVAGVAKAQQWKQCVPYGDYLCSDKNKAALNNQCPVCGEMAEKYPRKGAYVADCGFYQGGPPTGSGCAGTSNLTRCKRCNAAFWQDAVS